MIRRLLILALALSVLFGCETDDLVSPGDYGGWIEGLVTDGDPEDLGGRWIEIDHIAWDGTVTDYQTETDDEGYYRIGVPNGRVVIGTSGATNLYFRHDGIAIRRSEADTLLVDGLVTRADFRCGRLEVVVTDGLDHPETWRRLALREPDPAFGVVVCSKSFQDDGGTLRVDFRMLPSGSYWLNGRGVYGGMGFYLPGSYRPLEAATVEVVAGSMTSYAATTPEPVVMSGSVLGSWQVLGLQPPEISVISQDGPEVFRDVCDEHGQFTLQLPVGGRFRLSFWIVNEHSTGRSFRRWVGGTDPESAQVFSLDGGQAVGGIDVVEGGLALTLPDDPVRTRTEITIEDAQGDRLGDLLYHDPEPIRMAGLEAGWYKVFVKTDGNAIPAYHDGTESFEEATAVEVRAGEVTAVPVVLAEGGRIEGRLSAPGGGPPTLSFVVALVDAANPNSAVLQYTSGDLLPRGFDYDPATGDFSYSLLPDGAYLLKILYDTSGWSWYPGVPDPDQATPLIIEDGGEVAGVVWQF